MKKIIISALIGALIVFVYQAASWMFLGIHANSTKAAANSEEVMSVLNTNMKESAVYDIPYWDMKANPEEQEKMAKEAEGKPWARISYHTSWSGGMGAPMARGYLLDLVAMFVLALIISKSEGSFSNRFMMGIYMSVYTLCLSVLMDWNWWATPGAYVAGILTDTIVIGILSGLWMAWYWGRGEAKTN